MCLNHIQTIIFFGVPARVSLYTRRTETSKSAWRVFHLQSCPRQCNSVFGCQKHENSILTCWCQHRGERRHVFWVTMGRTRMVNGNADLGPALLEDISPQWQCGNTVRFSSCKCHTNKKTLPWKKNSFFTQHAPETHFQRHEILTQAKKKKCTPRENCVKEQRAETKKKFQQMRRRLKLYKEELFVNSAPQCSVSLSLPVRQVRGEGTQKWEGLGAQERCGNLILLLPSKKWNNFLKCWLFLCTQ